MPDSGVDSALHRGNCFCRERGNGIFQMHRLPRCSKNHGSCDPDHQFRTESDVSDHTGKTMKKSQAAQEGALGDEDRFEQSFVEQAEYIEPDRFLQLNAEHPDEPTILRKLKGGGAKLLVGPRGCGKTTLMLKAHHQLLNDGDFGILSIYVNFKLSLKLEPLYVRTSNAPFWFRTWLNLKILAALHETLRVSEKLKAPRGMPSAADIANSISAIENGADGSREELESFSHHRLSSLVDEVLSINELNRCVLLLDDAAHAFSPKQQEDFFDFFREIKSRRIVPKAAVYPGITSHAPTFHVGHDAEQIDVWVRPIGEAFENYMREMATKRFGGKLPAALADTPLAVEFLAYASFGIPRSFLNMLRTFFEDKGKYTTAEGRLDRRKVFELARQAKESAHTVYDSLQYKLPSFSNFVSSGDSVYQSIVLQLKEFNNGKLFRAQGVEIGLKKPIPQNLERVLGFFQYAGLIMPTGENSRGVKGVFEIYMIHFGDLITENAIVGARTKRIESFVEVLQTQSHQAWPRIDANNLIDSRHLGESAFKLKLPHCQNCGSERISEHAKFCHNCGSQLKSTSLYDELVNQDISVLPISATLVRRIKSESRIRKIRDILIDSDKTQLRGVGMIGPVRAQRIANWAEEHVA